ncbi:DUF3616 domain-containing protein [Candidatus Sumerlaeota bacterium]|nr:DUF3616 domain-containing protein [Candidatus Sumerlaeota bacterium]
MNGTPVSKQRNLRAYRRGTTGDFALTAIRPRTVYHHDELIKASGEIMTTPRITLTLMLMAAALTGSAQEHKNQPVTEVKSGAATDKALLEVSAAARMGDATFFAGDEEDYPVWMVKDQAMKSFKIKNPSFGDIEALVPLSDTDLLIVCSQALSEDSSYKGKRTRIGLLSFAKGLDADPTITAYNGFRDDVVGYFSEKQDNFSDFTALTTKPPRDGGLSIEGAAYDQKSGVLYLGTRDGRSKDGGAVLFTVTNIKAVMELKEKPKFGSLTRIQLSSHGVRDLAFNNDRVFILFGAMRGMQKPGASIASWNPAQPGTVEMYDLPGLSDLMRAEALFIDGSGQAHVFEDLDDNKVPQDVASIEHTFKLSGAATKTLPPPATPAPAGSTTAAASPAAVQPK